MAVCAIVISPAPPMPCTARNATIWPKSCAAAQASEASTNTASAGRNSRRRPYRSDNLPKIGVAAVPVSRYADMIQLRCRDPASCAAIFGTAGTMMVWSSAASRMHSATPLTTRRICGCVKRSMAMLMTKGLAESAGQISPGRCRAAPSSIANRGT